MAVAPWIVSGGLWEFVESLLRRSSGAFAPQATLRAP
jgi:hypothetical protein